MQLRSSPAATSLAYLLELDCPPASRVGNGAVPIYNRGVLPSLCTYVARMFRYLLLVNSHRPCPCVAIDN